MDDMERYGDYNEIDEAPGKRGGAITVIFKILIGIICISVVGVLVFRMVVFNYYPDNMKNIHYTDKLTALYDNNNGDIGAKTQVILSPYDDGNKGNFFVDYPIFLPQINELQITLRYNISTEENIMNKYGLSEFDIEADDALSFRLYDNKGRIYDSIVYTERDEFLMYRYHKLVFSDVLYYGEDGVCADVSDLSCDDAKWIRLEVFVKGQENKPFGMILIYENHENYNKFSDYELSKEEMR